MFCKKAGFAVHDETNGVTTIVVHKTSFGINLKLTATLEQIVPVFVQKGNIPVYSNSPEVVVALVRVEVPHVPGGTHVPVCDGVDTVWFLGTQTVVDMTSDLCSQAIRMLMLARVYDQDHRLARINEDIWQTCTM